MAVLSTLPEGYNRTHIRWDGGWLEFDAVLRQSIEHDADITEHPVDSGASIVDHFRALNVPIILDAEITNTPLSQPLTHTDGSSAVQSITEIELPSPILPGAPTTLFGFDISSRRSVRLSTLNYEPGMNRIKAVLDELLAMQGRHPDQPTEPRLLTVALSSLGTFDNMMLKRFSIDRDSASGSSMPVVLEFRQVLFAELTTEEVKIEKPKKPRSNKAKDKGKQGTSDGSAVSKKQSTLFGLLN